MPSYPPQGVLGYAQGYPPPAGAYQPPQGYPPPMPGYPTPQEYGGYPAYPSHGYPYGAPGASEAPPFPGAPTMPGSPPFPGAQAMPGAPPFPGAPGGGMPVPGAQAPQSDTEPQTVLYRDIAIHNPRYSSGVFVYGYTRDAIQHDINEIKEAADNEKKIIDILTRLGPLKLEVVAQNFQYKPLIGKLLNGIDALAKFVVDKTKGDAEKCLLGLILGPLKYDVELVRGAIKRMGTDEEALNEILLDLTPAEVGLLAQAYHNKYKEPKTPDNYPTLANHVRADLSGAYRNLFEEVLDPNRQLLPSSVPDVKLVQEDVQGLHDALAGPGKKTTDKNKFYKILTGRRHDHLVQVGAVYRKTWDKKDPKEKDKEEYGKLLKDIKEKFSGDERKALLWIVSGAELNYEPYLKSTVTPHALRNADPQALRDAEKLEKTMLGPGTNKELLARRLLRAHWSRPRMARINEAFLSLYKKQLIGRVEEETTSLINPNSAFKQLLIALIEGSDRPQKQKK
ncbi:hypothetical protein C8R44DRAFT_760672 [Mycena epipterygia]|nr:hypothetical protein C8R44DRAFT_760672 [Mycena epipterygia]